jgi:hypothetical protein
MGESKRLLMEAEEEDRPIPSHLVKEMFSEMVILKKQMKLIKQALEIKDEDQSNTYSNNSDDDRV